MSARRDISHSVILLGLGNSILCDDGIGIHVVRSIEAKARALGAEVAEAEIAGFALLDLLGGHDAAVVVDAVRMPGLEPGAVVVLDSTDFVPSLHLVAAHQIDLPAALALGRELKIKLPERVSVVGVQIEDDTTFCEHCTSAVAAAELDAGTIALDLVRDLVHH